MNKKAKAAYEEALRRIEACRLQGKMGTRLDLNSIGLTRVPPEIGQLSALIQLFLHTNKLTRLPSEIGELIMLQKLWLNKNQITKLPSEIGQLSALTHLYLDDNLLTNLPPEVGQISSLKQLWISNNKLASLPPEIGRFSKLTVLSLPDNQLRSLPPEIGLIANLEHLWLQKNQLKSLPLEIKYLSSLTDLFLHGNSGLQLPPSALGPPNEQCKDQGGELNPAQPAEILDYYFSTREQAGRALREVKVIFVGRGEVGKTSMVEVLRDKNFAKNKARTDGIAITSWPVMLKDGAAELMLWDFGGQEIMHGTHQFFLTHRSLYVVMVDGRHDRGRQDAEYWLKMVRAFGGDSPVLVVMNRQKAHSFDLDREALSIKYGVAMEHFFRTDCEILKTIQPLREMIHSEAARMLAAEERFPASYWDVKTRLAQMKQHGEDYLSDQDYQTLCIEHGVTEEPDQQKLLRRLADLGTVVSFPDDVRMAALSVLNPEWATDGIYRVVTNEELREKSGGLLTLKKLRELLPKDRWPKDLHVQYVLDLMCKFDLCFPVDAQGHEMLVPELLPDKTPPQGDWDVLQCVVFQYHYSVLPYGVLPRFITRTQKLSRGQLRWRSGVMLANDGAEARVQADYDTNILNIWVRSRSSEARRELLKIIRLEFKSIHARIEGLNVNEMLAVPGYADIFVNLRDLNVMLKSGRETYLVVAKNEVLEIPIKELLREVFDLGQDKLVAELHNLLPIVATKRPME
jgi:internalin A